jgi:predicted Zn-dependent peptidase
MSKQLGFDFYATAEEVTLPNGLTVVAAHRPNAQWENILFGLRSGAKDDPIGLEGLAHFLEHQLVWENSEGALESRAYFSKLGDEVNLGSTTMLGTMWSCRVPKKDCASAINFFSQVLFGVSWNKVEAFSKERQVILREYKLETGLSDLDKIYSLFNPNPWVTRHPLGAIGTVEGINAIRFEDLVSFHQKHYQPSHLIVVADGGLPLNELIVLLQNSRFGESHEPQWQNPLLNPKVTFKKPFVRLLEEGRGEFSEVDDNPVYCEIFCYMSPDPDFKMAACKQILFKALRNHAFLRLRHEKQIIYSSDQFFKKNFLMADEFHFSIRLDKRDEVKAVVAMWEDFCGWLETSAFEVFCKQQQDCEAVRSEYFDDYWDGNFSLDVVFHNCLQSVPTDALTEASHLERWETVTAKQVLQYLRYLREYVLIIRRNK